MTQPDCLDLLPSRQTVALASTPVVAGWLTPGWGMWIGVGLSILIFELVAVLMGWDTMTQTVRHGPTWAKWVIGGGLVWVLWHLFVQGR